MKPLIAVPMGDAGGIGPEIVVKALGGEETFPCADCVIVGDGKILENAIRITRSPLTIKRINHPREGRYEKNTINLIDLDNIDMSTWKIGEIQAQCGLAAFEYIKASVALAMEGAVDAVATTPINKEALKKAGVDFIGHTEIFARLTGTQDPLTMFEVKGLRVFFLSRHMSLMDAVRCVSRERIIDYVIRCTQALTDLGVTEGTMAVAGLNPHSGENGLFGSEEVNYIIPAVKELQAMGYQVEGPIGADSVFHLALKGRYNSVLSLYHDQGHIAAKTLDFDRTVSITCGMPILRTSVDHGTAMDIAGKNLASSISMEEAIRVAAKYSNINNQRNNG